MNENTLTKDFLHEGTTENKQYIYRQYVERIAKIYQTIDKTDCGSFIDRNQPLKNEAPQQQKDNEIDNVNFILYNPDDPPNANYESWLAQKCAEGWKYASIKDIKEEEYPCFVLYDELSPEQKSKLHNYMFTTISGYYPKV